MFEWLKKNPNDKVKTQENVKLVLRKGDNNDKK